MKDMRTFRDKLIDGAWECRQVSRRATDWAKQELSERLADHMKSIAVELDRTIDEDGQTD